MDTRNTACILAENRKPDAQNRKTRKPQLTEKPKCPGAKTDLKNGRNRKPKIPTPPRYVWQYSVHSQENRETIL